MKVSNILSWIFYVILERFGELVLMQMAFGVQIELGRQILKSLLFLTILFGGHCHLGRAQEIVLPSSPSEKEVLSWTNEEFKNHVGQLSEYLFSGSSIDGLKMAFDLLKYEDYLLNLDRGAVANIYRLIARFYDSLDDHVLSLEYKDRSSKLFLMHGDTASYYYFLGETSLSYIELGEYEKGHQIALEALKYELEKGKKDYLSYNYYVVARILLLKGELAQAKAYTDSVLLLARAMSENNMLGAFYSLRGRYYTQLNMLDSAQYYFQKCIDSNLTHDGLALVAEVAELLAQNFNKMGHYNRTVDACETYLPIADSTQNFNYSVSLRRELFNAHKAIEAYEQATQVSSELLVLEDSLREVKRNNQAMMEQIRLESTQYISTLEEQDEQNQLTIDEQQSKLFWFLVGIVLLIIISAVIYWSLVKNRKLSRLNKQQAEHLKLLDAAKTRFFANISHDLRSPLTLVIGGIEQVLKSKDSALTVKDENYLKVSAANSERMINMTNEINELVKMDEGKLQLDKKYVDLIPYLGVYTGMFLSATEPKGISLNFKVGDLEKAVVEIDPYQFEKVIYNLISNAIKYSGSGDSIDVSVIEQGEDVCIVLADTGEGIPGEMLPYIFDRYYQAPDQSYRTREGFGIGLTFVKEIADRHGAQIDVESEIGKGSKFTIKLKRILNPNVELYDVTKHVTLDSIEHDLSRGTDQPYYDIENIMDSSEDEKVSVLVVEDHEDIRNYVHDIVKSQYYVYQAANGMDALKVLESEEIDLIVTDLMMPGMDGFGLLENLRKTERYKKIPILVLSARTTEEARDKVLSLGVNDFLAKPFKPTELMARMDNLMSIRQVWEGENAGMLSLKDDPTLNDLEKSLLKEVERLIFENLNDSNLSVGYLASEIAVSERKFYRLIKKLTDKTPLELIKDIRLQFAHRMITEQKVQNASEVAKSIGMTNVTHFNKDFKKKFGKTPQELI